MTQAMTIQLKTLTPIWTGGVDQKPDRLHETGLIGSLRWWYEALVRGLGGYACDPTSADDRCPDSEGNHCAACELFGCTGWARKFRLRVADEKGNLMKGGDQKEGTVLTLEFLPLRPICPEEKWLLAKAVEIAARYGAFCGKTTSLRRTYGCVKLAKDPQKSAMSKDRIKQWLAGFRRAKNEEEWADLRRFLFAPNVTFSEDPRQTARRIDKDFLLGDKDAGRSRKIFVFKKPDKCFGYFRNDESFARALQEWRSKSSVKTGKEVIDEL